ncbi:hypothetical protein RVM24_00895 [Marinobacter sp. KM021]|uniref:hypothetical protein n=1 Tax=Marinobacter sp. KM021 TaxID=3075616 RepID=UPI003D6ADC23
MFRIDGPGATQDNKFTEGDPANGTRATLVTDEWLNAVQEELSQAIEAEGLELNKLDSGQLLKIFRKRPIKVDSVADLASLSLQDGQSVHVKAFWIGYEFGGGLFFWQQDKAKTEHDGGTVIDPQKLVDLTAPGNFGSYFAAAGSGTGCYVRTGRAETARDFGAVFDGAADDEPALNAYNNPNGNVSAYSVTAAALQNGPLIVDMQNKIKWTGQASDAAYNKAVFQEVLAGLPNGAELEFPSRGYACVDGGITADIKGLSMRGTAGAGSFDKALIQFQNTTGDSMTFTGYGLLMEGMKFKGVGTIPARGSDVTQTLFNLAMATTDADHYYFNCGFSGANVFFSVKDQPLRNFKAVGCTFSIAQRVFEYTHLGGSDVRDLEFFANRYHSIGRVGDLGAAIIFIDPASNIQNVLIQDGHADDSVELFRGYASGTEIAGVPSRRAVRGYVDADSSGHGITGSRRGFMVGGGQIIQPFSPELSSVAAISLKGSAAAYMVDGVKILGAGGHGIFLDSAYAEIQNARIHNVGQNADATYDGFHFAPTATSPIVGGGCSYRQDRYSVATNKARFGVNNLASGTYFQERILVDNVVGNEYNYDPTKESRGPDPQGFGGFHRESFGSSAPTTGTWRRGDIVRDADPVASGKVGFVCIASGSPGSWKPYGAIDA